MRNHSRTAMGMPTFSVAVACLCFLVACTTGMSRQTGSAPDPAASPQVLSPTAEAETAVTPIGGSIDDAYQYEETPLPADPEWDERQPAFLEQIFSGSAVCPAPCIDGVHPGQSATDAREILQTNSELDWLEINAVYPPYCPSIFRNDDCISWGQEYRYFVEAYIYDGEVESLNLTLFKGVSVEWMMKVLGSPEYLIIGANWAGDISWMMADMLYPQKGVSFMVFGKSADLGLAPDLRTTSISFTTVEEMMHCSTLRAMIEWHGYGGVGVYYDERGEPLIEPIYPPADSCGRELCIFISGPEEEKMFVNPLFGTEPCDADP